MRLLILFFLVFSTLEASVCYFIPPKNWEAAQLKKPSPHVKIGFIGKGSTDFRPSINLATEEVNLSLKEYVKVVKELHLQDPQVKLRDLGKFSMKGGKGQLLEMSNPSPFGEMKLLQAILVKKGTAYILTAAVLKKEFTKFQKDLLIALESLDLAKDIWSPIQNVELKDKLKSLFSSLGSVESKDKEWKTFQKEILAIDSLGPYWKFLALKEGKHKIYD